MKPKKNTLTIFALFLLMMQSAGNVQAQIRVGGRTAPNSNAVLDLNANDTINGTKGLLLPRVELVSLTDATPLTAHIAGMKVYNTAMVNNVFPGVYYNDGTKWVRSEGGDVQVVMATPTERHIEIVLNKEISTQSVVYYGCTPPVSSKLIVGNIKPIFSCEDVMINFLDIRITARADENETSVKWMIQIKTSNIDTNIKTTLQSIVITYFCHDQLYAINENDYENLLKKTVIDSTETNVGYRIFVGQ